MVMSSVYKRFVWEWGGMFFFFFYVVHYAYPGSDGEKATKAKRSPVKQPQITSVKTQALKVGASHRFVSTRYSQYSIGLEK